MACQKHPENVRLEQIIWTEKLGKKWSFLGDTQQCDLSVFQMKSQDPLECS